MRIYFEDNGQDVEWLDIDQNGVVFDCGPSPLSFLKGKTVEDLDSLAPGMQPIYKTKHGFVQSGHKIEAINYNFKHN